VETTPVELRMTYPQSNRPTDIRATITVRDEESGYLIVQLQLTAEQVVSLLTSSGVFIIGTLASAASRARLSKRRVIHSLPIPREVTGYSYRDNTIAQTWAETAMAEANAAVTDGVLWQECWAIAHNHGWMATFARWDVLTEDDMPRDQR
jgi:hypothetical protein